MSRQSYSDLYAALGVDRDATKEEIQRAFKFTSRHFHPDKQQQSDVAADTFKRIRLAHDVLTNDVLRLAYDVAGLKAVDLIRQSLARKERQNENDTNITTSTIIDLYTAIQNAPTQQDAIAIIQRAVDSSELNTFVARQAPLNCTIVAPIILYSMHENHVALRRSAASLISVQTRRRVFGHQVGLVSTAQMRKTGQVECQTQWSFTPVTTKFGPIGTVDLVFNHSDSKSNNNSRNNDNNMPPSLLLPLWPVIKIHSSRTLASETNIETSWSGDLRNPQTHMYTFGSSRTFNKPAIDAANKASSTKSNFWHASWQLAVSAVTGQVQFAQVEFRQVGLAFPKLMWRLSMDAITAQVETKSKWLFEYSWHFTWSTYKVLYTFGGGNNNNNSNESSNNKWKLLTGIAFSDRKMVTSTGIRLPAWKILFTLHSNEWNVRLPITVSSTVEPMLYSVLIATLIGKCLDELVDVDRNDTENTQTPLPTTPTISLDLIRDIAATKREYSDLIILDAKLNDTHNITDFLQYWTRNDKLFINTLLLQDWAPQLFEKQEEQATTMIQFMVSKFQSTLSTLQSMLSSLDTAEDVMDTTLPSIYIRYEYKDGVYEILQKDVTEICLPNPTATRIGQRGVTK